MSDSRETARCQRPPLLQTTKSAASLLVGMRAESCSAALHMSATAGHGIGVAHLCSSFQNATALVAPSSMSPKVLRSEATGEACHCHAIRLT